MNKLILDADGVFFSERPYWNASLASALCACGLGDSVGGQWQALADTAYGRMSLQQVTKGRGCNSNWDMTAVFIKALEDRLVHLCVAECIRKGNLSAAMHELKQAAGSLWRDAPEKERGRDPLEGFGIVRDSEFFRAAVSGFQSILRGEPSIPLCLDRSTLKEPYEETCSSFAQCVELGFSLRVCTSRHRVEAEQAIKAAELGEYLPPEAVTTADEPARAQEETGVKPLGKPHWFSPMCAALGYDAAIECLRGNSAARSNGTLAYVGDALADFRAVCGAREQGLDIKYIHIRSGVTTREQEELIGGSIGVVKIIDRLTELPEIVGRLGK